MPYLVLSKKLTIPPPLFFWPSNELTALIFWRSPLPLNAAVWQWVAIWYLSAPPPPPRMKHDVHYNLIVLPSKQFYVVTTL